MDSTQYTQPTEQGEQLVVEWFGMRTQAPYTVILTGDVHEDMVEVNGCRAYVSTVYRRLVGGVVFDNDRATHLMHEVTGRTYSALVEE